MATNVAMVTAYQFLSIILRVSADQSAKQFLVKILRISLSLCRLVIIRPGLLPQVKIFENTVEMLVSKRQESEKHKIESKV